MKPITLIILFFLFLSLIPTTTAQSEYIVLRVNVNPLYIENETIRIEVLPLYFQNNKPTNENVNIHIKILVDHNQTYNNTFVIISGKSQLLTMPSQLEGRGLLTIYSENNNVTSKKYEYEFGITKAPIPYTAYFNNDGSKLYFRSLKLNSTAQIDLNYTFTIYEYYYYHGAGESLINTYKDVTLIEIDIPKEGQIVYFEVLDIYGWWNSQNIRINEFDFSGIPLSFDHGYMEREPYKSDSLGNNIIIVMVVTFITFLFWRRS